MAFSINSFRSTGLTGAGARPNLFECGITGQGVPANFRYLCKIASIPPSTMGVVEVPYFGRMVKIPGNRTFDNLSVTVLNDENMAVRNAIESWMNKMNSHVANVATDPSTLFAVMSIKHFARGGGDGAISGAEWKFVNCFPVALGEIGLDWGSNDAIEEFTIDFAYDYWTHGSQTDE
tara:strand:- start:107 stop:637 length:531 start_codon:yes stop_codon:yes gene_type:complete